MAILDIDGNGSVGALTDGLLLLRYLLGLRGSLLLSGAVGMGATRTTEDEIIAYIEDKLELFDVDGNGETKAESDGVLIFRHLFSFFGDVLIDGVVEPGARRNTAEEIADYIDDYLL